MGDRGGVQHDARGEAGRKDGRKAGRARSRSAVNCKLTRADRLFSSPQHFSSAAGELKLAGACWVVEEEEVKAAKAYEKSAEAWSLENDFSRAGEVRIGWARAKRKQLHGDPFNSSLRSS